MIRLKIKYRWFPTQTLLQNSEQGRRTEDAFALPEQILCQNEEHEQLPLKRRANLCKVHGKNGTNKQK